MRLLPSLLALLALLATSCLSQPLPIGTYIQDPASEFIYLAFPDPGGAPVYLYNSSVIVSNGYSFSAQAVMLQNPSTPTYNHVNFTGHLSCDQESGGLNVALLSCSDQGQLCETGWMAETMGQGPYTFGVGVDQSTGFTFFDIGAWLSAASTVPFLCSVWSGNPGYPACGIASSTCRQSNPLVSSAVTVAGETFVATGGTPSAASGAVTVSLLASANGNVVTVRVPTFSLTTGTTNTAITAQIALPLGYRPSVYSVVAAPIPVTDSTDTSTLLVAPSILTGNFISYQLVTQSGSAFPATFPTAKALVVPAHTFTYVLV